MKKILTILATAALAASVLASCSRKVDYTEIPFVYFNNASISVSEDAGIIEIPVMALANTEFVVTFETEDGQKKDSNTGQMVPNGENGTLQMTGCIDRLFIMLGLNKFASSKIGSPMSTVTLSTTSFSI